jgi:hypothetical protein
MDLGSSSTSILVLRSNKFTKKEESAAEHFGRRVLPPWLRQAYRKINCSRVLRVFIGWRSTAAA